MNDPNKRNLQYFKNASMDGLFADMKNWQNTNQKRLLSTSIQKDGDMFCCVALSNPSEVVIVSGLSQGGVWVSDNKLNVFS